MLRAVKPLETVGMPSRVLLVTPDTCGNRTEAAALLPFTSKSFSVIFPIACARKSATSGHAMLAGQRKPSAGRMLACGRASRLREGFCHRQFRQRQQHSHQQSYNTAPDRHVPSYQLLNAPFFPNSSKASICPTFRVILRFVGFGVQGFRMM